MNILLLLLSVVFISAYAFYLNNKLNTYSKKLALREDMLKNAVEDIAERERGFKESYNAKLADILQKESEIKQCYNDSLVIEEKASDKVVLLQNQIIKLKTELNNARLKSKRLAKKIQE
jgi:hypothetical protein